MVVITLLWERDPAVVGNYWETDWLRLLFRGRQTRDVVVGATTQYIDYTVFITSSLTDPQQVKRFQQYTARGLHFGVVLLSDEYGTFVDPADYPTGATFVFRNYYYPSQGSSVKFFPLGYKTGWWVGYDGQTPDRLTAATRPYDWSFVGTVKSDRTVMLNHMTAWSAQCYTHYIGGWNASDSLSTEAYRNILLKTLYVPNGTGNSSLDCFRVWEALEAGCIPIVTFEATGQRFKSCPVPDYFNELVKACGYETPVPFPVVKDWAEVATLPKGAEAEGLRLRCYKWWQGYKKHTQSEFQRGMHRVVGGR